MWVGVNKMYDFSGWIFRLMTEGGKPLIFGIILIVLSFFEKSQKLRRTTRSAGYLGVAFALICSGYFVYCLANPVIKTHEGYFSSQYRDTSVVRYSGSTYGYAFTNGKDPKPVFYLDRESKKKIYDEEFDTETAYRVYYEDRTNIIVKVEALDGEPMVVK